MPDYSDMVDELGPDSLAACSGSTSVPHAGVGGSAALVAASSATSKQQGGAAVLQDPISALDGRWCSGRLSAVPEGRGLMIVDRDEAPGGCHLSWRPRHGLHDDLGDQDGILGAPRQVGSYLLTHDPDSSLRRQLLHQTVSLMMHIAAAQLLA